MPTRLSIDTKLLRTALTVSGMRTSTAAVTKALEEFIARRHQRTLIDLFNKLQWDSGFEYKRA
jgi:Bacterial antitoxin of type II TA system, VapB